MYRLVRKDTANLDSIGTSPDGNRNARNLIRIAHLLDAYQSHDFQKEPLFLHIRYRNSVGRLLAITPYPEGTAYHDPDRHYLLFSAPPFLPSHQRMKESNYPYISGIYVSNGIDYYIEPEIADYIVLSSDDVTFSELYTEFISDFIYALEEAQNEHDLTFSSIPSDFVITQIFPTKYLINEYEGDPTDIKYELFLKWNEKSQVQR